MKHIFFLVNILFVSSFCFAQQSPSINIFGRIPAPEDNRTYQIQVGSFRVIQNAERVYNRLSGASLNPVYENYLNFTRVILRGISARDVPQYIDRLQRMGFSEILIRMDAGHQIIPGLPVSTAALPVPSLSEIGYRTIRVGETANLNNIAGSRNIVSWTSSTPQSVSVDSSGNITGHNLGNAYIMINPYEYISVVIVPQDDFFIVPQSLSAFLPPESNTGGSEFQSITEYRTEPTFRLAYRFNNKGENRGASGGNGGIDILARGANYQWLWTTFFQGGWFYDLNGIKREMINGFQKDANNGVELAIKPEFVYDKGVPYLQLVHLLHNPNNFPVTAQRFGASADVMIHENDHASLLYTPYGARMTDSLTDPSLELILVCTMGSGITPVDTLWLGTYDFGRHLDYIYVDSRSDIHHADSAIGFSYQNIALAPGETKQFIIRFTLARRNEN